MNAQEDRIAAEAAAWHVASHDDAMDWDGFTLWLEADPRHARIYDEIARTDALLDDHRAALADALDRKEAETAARPRFAGGRAKWAGIAGLAVAASLAAVLALPHFAQEPEVYRTAAASRRIALDDGSTVTLAPRSSLTVSGSGQNRIALAGGAWFDIRHDPARTMTITAGPLEMRDIGTRFDVQAQPSSVRVGVAEGRVSVASQALAQAIQLEAGRRLTFDGAAGTAIVDSSAASAIGSWRAGRLFYDGAALPLVLADLSRYAGVNVTLPDSLRSRQFTGSLIVKDGEAAIRDLAEVMDLELGRDGGGFSLRERGR